MVDYREIREKLEHELSIEWHKIDGEMNPSQLCHVKDLICAIKDAATIQAMDENSYGGGSSEGYYEPGVSEARGGSRRTRDSMGRYSGRYPYQYDENNGGRGGSSYRQWPMSTHPMSPMRYYSRTDSKESIMSKLKLMLNDPSTTERERRGIEDLMSVFETE